MKPWQKQSNSLRAGSFQFILSYAETSKSNLCNYFSFTTTKCIDFEHQTYFQLIVMETETEFSIREGQNITSLAFSSLSLLSSSLFWFFICFFSALERIHKARYWKLNNGNEIIES